MGEVLTRSAVVVCFHGGQAQPTVPLARVLLSGQPAVGAGTPYLVTGCAETPPCVTAFWASSAQRVRSAGIPLVLADSTGVCLPTGAEIVVAAAVSRESGRPDPYLSTLVSTGQSPEG